MSKKLSAYLLFALALVMFYLGYQIQGLPPVVTGVGFLVIGLTFLGNKK